MSPKPQAALLLLFDIALGRDFTAHGGLASEYACNLFCNAVTLTATVTTDGGVS